MRRGLSRGSNGSARACAVTPEGDHLPKPVHVPGAWTGRKPRTSDGLVLPLSARERRTTRPSSQPSELGARIRTACGRAPEVLVAEDVRGNHAVKAHLAELHLNQFFDERGVPLFTKLGLSFAAKQHARGPIPFGSRHQLSDRERVAKEETKTQSTRAFFLATEARERDLEFGKRRNAELLETLDFSQRHQTEDVHHRQLEVLFCEVPGFEKYLPSSVDRKWLLPAEADRETEKHDRRTSERANVFLQDVEWRAGKSMNWMLTRAEVIVLLEIANLWTRATRGMQCPAGMDRTSFCRFILDLGLVDQERVPFFWAVSLFDSVARPVHCCPTEQLPFTMAPAVPVVNRWLLVTLLDTILRQLFDEHTKGAFMVSLLPIARLALPQSVIDESGLQEGNLRRFLRGEDTAAFPVSPSHLRPDSPTAVLQADAALEEVASKGSSGTPKDGAAKAGEERGPSCGTTHQPEKPCWQLDLQRESSMREQLVRSMLVEPEVLHIVAQHCELFRQLHAAYADEKGDMTYAAMLQFCMDFHLTPAFASSHFLETVYESVKSHDLVLAPCDFNDDEADRMSIATSATAATTSTAESRKHSTRARKAARRIVLTKPTPSRGLRKSVYDASPDGKFGSSAQDADFVSHQRSLQRNHGYSDGAPHMDGASVRSQSKPVSELEVGRLQDHLHGLPWKRLAERAYRELRYRRGSAPSQAQTNYIAIFGPGAFTEALCRVAITYLGFYGSAPQQCTTGYTRIAWLIAYLHSVFVHLRQSFERRSKPTSPDGTPVPPFVQLPGPLGRALQQVPLELFTSAPYSPPEGGPSDLLRMPTLRPGVPHVGPTQFLMKRKVHGSKHKDKEKRPQDGTPVRSDSMTRSRAPESARGKAGEGANFAEPSREDPYRRESDVSSVHHVEEDELPLGEPCVQNGYCRVCCSHVEPNTWGNPRCNGCSVVDTMCLQMHPFKPLLLEWPSHYHIEAPTAKKPVRLPRADLSPPPRGQRDAFHLPGHPSTATGPEDAWAA